MLTDKLRINMHAKILGGLMMIAWWLCSITPVKAGPAVESYQNQVKGKVRKGDTLIVKDEKFQNSAFDWDKIRNRKVTDIITFGLDMDSVMALKKAFKCQLELKIEYWSQPDQGDPVIVDHVKLDIAYDTAKGVSYQAAANYHFQNGYRVKITVNSIGSAELGDSLPAAFQLTGQVIVERSYQMDTTTIIPKVVVKAPVTPKGLKQLSVTNNTTDVYLTWGKIIGAEEYDLEWTFIDETSTFGQQLQATGTGTPAATLAAMFRNNATRVTLQQEYYDISVVNYSQYLLVRIRPVQSYDDGTRHEFPWSYELDDKGQVASGVITLNSLWYQPLFNWQYNAVYAEEGKKKEVVSFFDGSLRTRQSVTINNFDQKAIVQETLYDEFGRPMVSILPAPQNSNILKYYPGLHPGNNGNYSFADAYGDAGACIGKPKAMPASSGAAQYYSPQNTFYLADQNSTIPDDKNSPNKDIPDANGYPFAVSRYTPDNTGRVAVQGSVGEIFQPGPDPATSKAVRYYYGAPQPGELDRLFGNDAGYASHYLKTMTVDGNGQVAIDYKDASGRTVVTSMAGEKPANVDALPSKKDAVQETEVLFDASTFAFDATKLALSASTTYLNAILNNVVTLTYNVDPLIKTYAGTGVTICSNCYYLLDIRITDNCKRDIYHQVTPVEIGSQTSDCNNTISKTGTISANFNQIGAYTISFTLKLTDDAITNYTNDFIARNPDLKKQWTDFVQPAVNAKDYSACFNDCATCMASLGQPGDFTNRILTQLSNNGVDVPTNHDAITSWAGNLYTTLLNNCKQLRLSCSTSPCDDLERAMEQDVSPGGQYALFDPLDTALESSINVLYYHWKDVFPEIDDHTSGDYIKDQFETAPGVLTSPHDKDFTLGMLVKYWNPAWAKSFVKYHPEYCALLFCIDYSSCKSWDQRLQNQAGTLEDLATVVPNAVYSRTNTTWLVDNDPFFQQHPDYMSQVKSDLPAYTNVVGLTGTASGNSLGVKSLAGFVDYMVYCSDPNAGTNSTNQGALGDNWAGCTPNTACRINNAEWLVYRDKYLELKQRYYQQIQSSAYCNNACSIGTPVTSSFGDCPQTSDFTISADAKATSCPGQQVVNITYIGAVPLPFKDTLQLYYPQDYDAIPNKVMTAILPAGARQLSICVDASVNVASMHIVSASCANGGLLVPPANGGNGSGDAFDCNNVPLGYFTLIRNLNSSTGMYNIGASYNGPAIPSGDVVYLVITVTVDGETALHTIQFTSNVSTGNYEPPMPHNGSGHSPTNYDKVRTQCSPIFSDLKMMSLAAVSACDPAYRYKISRVTNVPFGASVGAPTDVPTLTANLTAQIQAAVHANCEAEADDWIQKLQACVATTDPNYAAKVSQLRAALIEVCSLGADAAHPFGASTTPPNTHTTAGYTSFKDAIVGVLGATALNQLCNPWLIDGPDPYGVTMQATDNIISRTSPDICTRLAALTAENSSGGSLYQYLVNKYGAAMTLTSDELTILQNGCGNCRYLLTKQVKLPVFLDGTATGCITASQYASAVNSLSSQLGTLDKTNANYEDIFTNFLNQQWGFTLTYDDYKAYGDKVGTTDLLCNHPAFTTVQPDPYSCMMENIDDAVAVGNTLYSEYIEEVRRQFRKDYIAYCGAEKPKFQLTSSRQNYHFTLYYYDQAGNLVRTIPPEGVHPLDDSQLGQVVAVRGQKDFTCTYTGPLQNTDKTLSLQEMSTLLQSSANSAIEMWLYNPAVGSSQMLATSSDKKYLVNVCIDGRYAHLDIYTMQSAADGSEVILTVSKHTVVDMQKVLPLKPFTHFVFQGSGLNNDNLAVYVNGVLCPLAQNAPNGSCGWEIGSNNGTITYPENLAMLKQIRFYNRVLTTDEIAANAADACMGVGAGPVTGLQVWGRFNVPSAGSGNTVDPGSTVETQYTPVYPQHTLATSYAYQSLNGMTTVRTPDAGISNYWYDNLGRMVASQNAEQLSPVQAGATANRFSYTAYDAQSRITEVGEKTGATSPSQVPFLAVTDVAAFQSSGTNAQITKSYYDNAFTSVPAVSQEQGNMRKRIAAVTYQDNATGDYQQATYYSYDQLGNVKTLWQQMLGLNDLKRIDYQYDLVSGKVNKVRYQNGNNKNDHFYYGYEYDAENRLIRSTTGVNTVSTDSWDIENAKTDAGYKYYLHGPLARMELGDKQLVQGLDYAYTLQGWLKGVNGQYLSSTGDMGRDGKSGTGRSGIGPDIYSYSLDYFTGDYHSISDNTAFPLSWGSGNTSDKIGTDLYNGNISRSTVALSTLNNGIPVGYTYRYDQLNRLKHMRQAGLTTGQTTWNAPATDPTQDPYHEDITYDGNGNILTYLRNGNHVGTTPMDNLAYGYNRDAAGNLLNNRLQQLTENAADSYSGEKDIKPVTNSGYSYDNIGNLITDRQELATDAGGNKIEWTVYGKIRRVVKPDGSSLEYRYDAGGNRVYKQYTHGTAVDKTWYVHDASGNVLAVYGNKNGDNTIYWKEQHLYGSSRLGIWEPDMAVTSNNSTSLWEVAGTKSYELTNHLGNVLSTIHDNFATTGGANIVSQQDYYPFGMMQPGRHSGSYRYGFNGQEKSDEIAGEGNHNTAEYWEYDTRIGRRWNLDPMPQISKSDYSVFSNNPIINIDPNGAYSRLGAAWRSVVWGGTTTHSDSRNSWGVTYTGKQWDENKYNVVTAFHGSRQSFGREERDEYLNNLENKEFWEEEVAKDHVKFVDDRFQAAGSWTVVALPVGKLMAPAKVMLAEGGAGLAANETKTIIQEAVQSGTPIEEVVQAATPLSKNSIIEGFKMSNHAWRKSGIGRGATEELVSSVINGAQQAGTIVNETGTGKFAGNIIKVFNYNGIKVAVDDTRKLIMSVRPETGFHLP